MPFIEGEDRHQIHLLPNTLDDFVDEENPIRVIDAYVDSLNLKELGFQVYSGTKAGQKPYRREDLLKLSTALYQLS
jgi:transposase